MSKKKVEEALVEVGSYAQAENVVEVGSEDFETPIVARSESNNDEGEVEEPEKDGTDETMRKT